VGFILCAAEPSNSERSDPFGGKMPWQVCECNLAGLLSLLAMYSPDSIEYCIIAHAARRLQRLLQEIYLKKGPTKQAAGSSSAVA
jgi:hypothetical protein